MMVSGIVVVTVARSSGPSESRISWVVWSFTTRSDQRRRRGCFETSAEKYFCEIFARVPSASRSASALSMAATRSESLRVATTCSETSPVFAAILTVWSPVDFW